MGTKITQAGQRYVKTIEILDSLPAEESLFQEGEYQRLTENGKIENLRVKIEPYPSDVALVSEIGNEFFKMKTWLVPGKTGLFCTITRRINLRNLFVFKLDPGAEFIIAAKGEIFQTDKLVERAWFYTLNGTFVNAQINPEDSSLALDDALVTALWKTTDEQEAALKLEELRGLLESGKVNFV